MRPITALKIGVSVAVGVLAIYGVMILAAIDSLKDSPFDPPPVAPLGRAATFEADGILETESGYVVAGVVGTSDPHRRAPCSGRFALVFLDAQGRAERATVLSGIETSRYCADRVDDFLPAPGRGWILAGTGVRDGGPAALFGGRSTDFQTVTLRLDESGALMESFGEDGLVEDHQAAGVLDGATFTTRLRRMTESGEVRDDLVVGEAAYEFWRAFEVERGFLVAVASGPGVTWQAFERDDPLVPRYHALPGATAATTNTLPLEADLGIGDTLLRDRVLYVAVRDRGGTRVNAVDPRRVRVVFGFNGTGAVRLPGYVTSERLLAAGPDGFEVATTAIDRGHHGDRLQVLRFGADGAADSSFGGRVKRKGRDVLLDPGLDDAVLDEAGRTLVLGGNSTLVRLTASGKIDPTFGRDGITRLRQVPVCELSPAARTDPCRGA